MMYRALKFLIPLGLCLTLIAGCAPPKKSQDVGDLDPAKGRPITRVEEGRASDFKTVEVDGVEMLQSRGEVGKYGGTFYTASIGEGPKTFNPWVSKDSSSSLVGGMLSSGLVSNDAYTGDVYPYLAEKVEVKDDRLTYIVTLRKGLVWSDGKPITSKDVVFTWNKIYKNGLGNPSHRDIVLVEGKFPEVRALDKLTIEFKTAKPFAPFMRNLGMNIAPEHVFASALKGKNSVEAMDKAFSALWTSERASKKPAEFVSSGMWLLESYDPGEQRAIFKRNPKFFMVDKDKNRLPYLDKYVISYVKDMNNEQLQFEQGKLDAYSVPAQYVVHVRKLKTPDFQLYNLGPTQTTQFVMFNLNTRMNPKTGKPMVETAKSRWFNNLYFRQAIDWAINREDLVANILKGVGQPLFTSIGPTSPFSNEKLAHGHQRDIEKARELLKRGGFRWDNKKQLLDKKGTPVEFNLLTNAGNSQREATGVNIKQDLAELGIKVNFKPMDFNVLIGKLDSGEWETMIMGLSGGDPFEPHTSANVWKSDSAIHMFNQRKPDARGNVNISDRLPWEKELDEIFEKGAQTFGFDQRKKIYDQFQQIIYEQAPVIYLYSPVNILAVKSRIRNFNPTPLVDFHNMEEIWIEEGK